MQLGDLLMANLLCKIGIHKWEYTDSVYENETNRRLGIQSKKGNRVCLKCKKKQIQEIHCLGLNPPEYIVGYFDNKPKVEGLPMANLKAKKDSEMNEITYVYVVYNREAALAVFSKKKDAESYKENNDRKSWVEEMILYEDNFDVVNEELKKAKNAALAKLTDDEKKVLGL
jgi:hypothetical protein